MSRLTCSRTPVRSVDSLPRLHQTCPVFVSYLYPSSPLQWGKTCKTLLRGFEKLHSPTVVGDSHQGIKHEVKRGLKSGKKKKKLNINICWAARCSGQTGAVPWDKRGPSLGQTGTVPGTNRPFSAEFHIKIDILSRLSLGRVGVRPWDDCPARAVRKMFMCFVFIRFFSTPIRRWMRITNCGNLASLARLKMLRVPQCS